ncbi:MAG: nucleotide exchange factor GrpE [Bacteroidales bacterium]|nr:nucleotide exchange factor GrpE [Bacteroidales bacterium]
MAKRKTPDQEKDLSKNNNDTSDNKTNSYTETAHDTDSDVKKQETSGEEASAASALAEDVSTDKVGSSEKMFQEKLAEMQDKYLRLSAEYDNYRKRTLREKMELAKYAEQDMLLKLFPVMDDFERAISHLEEATDLNAMKEGLILIYSKLNEVMKQIGVSEIEALNCPFNFEVHDAVAKTPVEEKDKKGRIVEVIQKGYYLKDKVIRHSKVVVGE